MKKTFHQWEEKNGSHRLLVPNCIERFCPEVRSFQVRVQPFTRKLFLPQIFYISYFVCSAKRLYLISLCSLLLIYTAWNKHLWKIGLQVFFSSIYFWLVTEHFLLQTSERSDLNWKHLGYIRRGSPHYRNKDKNTKYMKEKKRNIRDWECFEAHNCVLMVPVVPVRGHNNLLWPFHIRPMQYKTLHL